jgi:hypothetical protein
MRAYKDYTGLKNNMLTGICFQERTKNKTFWLFKCDCGNEKIIEAVKVFSKTNITKSCGCYKIKLQIEKNKNRKPITELKKSSYINSIFGSYKNRAKRKKISFELSKDMFYLLISDSCFYCGDLPSNLLSLKSRSVNRENISFTFNYNGIDRVNNKLGYTFDNSVTCCNICNKAKRDLELNVFKNWIKRLSNYQSIFIL